MVYTLCTKAKAYYDYLADSYAERLNLQYDINSNTFISHSNKITIKKVLLRIFTYMEGQEVVIDYQIISETVFGTSKVLGHVFKNYCFYPRPELYIWCRFEQNRDSLPVNKSTLTDHRTRMWDTTINGLRMTKDTICLGCSGKVHDKGYDTGMRNCNQSTQKHLAGEKKKELAKRA